MGTRSRIGYVVEGTDIVKSVYCHWDGYLKYNGEMLRNYYKTYDDAVALVSLGSISSLGETIEFRAEDDNDTAKTRDYHRWRGEEIEIETDYGVDDFLNNAFDCCEEYAYLFMDGEWWWTTDPDDPLCRLNYTFM